MTQKGDSQDSLSAIERLLPQTLARVSAIPRQTVFSTFSHEYRRQTPLFILGVAALTLAGIAGVVIGKLTLFAAVVPLLFAAGVVLGLGFPLISVWVLLASVTLERLNFFLLSSGKVNVRIDEILAIAVAVGFGLRLMQQRELAKKLNRVPGFVPLVSFFAATLFATLLNHHQLQKGVTFLTILGAGILLYATIALLMSEVKRVEQITNALTVIGTIENALGLIVFCVAYVFWLPGIFGVQIEPSSGLLEATGSMFEGNVFGHFSGAILVFILALLLSFAFRGQLFRQRSMLLAAAGVIALLTLIVTFSRGGWLGAIMGGIVVMLFSIFALDSQALAPARQRIALLIAGNKEQSSQYTARIAIATVLFVVIVLAIIVGGSHTTIGARVADAFQTSSGTGAVRIQDAQGALTEWQADPLFGRGAGNTAQSPDASANAPPWILSMGIEILHDSGIIGALLFLWFLWSVYRHLWSAARRAHTAELQGVIIGSTGALTCVLIGAQLTNSMFLMLPWAFLGLAGAMPLLVRYSLQSKAARLSQAA